MSTVVDLTPDATRPITEIEWVAMVDLGFGDPLVLALTPKKTVLHADGGGEAGQDGIRLAIRRGLVRIDDGFEGLDEPVLTPLGNLALMAVPVMDTRDLTVAALMDAFEATRGVEDGRDRKNAALAHLIQTTSESTPDRRRARLTDKIA